MQRHEHGYEKGSTLVATIIVKVAGDRLIELFRDAASELVREPLEALMPLVAR